MQDKINGVPALPEEGALSKSPLTERDIIIYHTVLVAKQAQTIYSIFVLLEGIPTSRNL